MCQKQLAGKTCCYASTGRCVARFRSQGERVFQSKHGALTGSVPSHNFLHSCPEACRSRARRQLVQVWALDEVELFSRLKDLSESSLRIRLACILPGWNDSACLCGSGLVDRRMKPDNGLHFAGSQRDTPRCPTLDDGGL